MLLNRKSVELLAPAGTWDALVAGVESGADAVYLGGKHFNMRMHEGEFNFDDALLKKAIDYAHEHGVRLYITLNNLISNEEIPALREYLPADWQGVYDAVKTGGYAGLSGRAQSIYEDTKAFDACAHFKIADQRTACEAQAVKGAQDKAFALDAYDKAKSRLNQIDQLMAKINDTPDPKAIAELQGRIAAEQAMIQNEQTKLQMYQMVAAAEDRLQEQRQREINAKVLANREYTKHQPFNLLDK